MTTPAYTNLDSNAPAGGTDPTTYSTANLANVRALRDMVITGRAAGFLMTRTQGTGPDVARPQYVTWINSVLMVGFRMVSTWGGTGSVQQTSVSWEWSNDNGATWASMGSAQANTFDANDNITGTTNSGGLIALVMEIWTKVLRLVANLANYAPLASPTFTGTATIPTAAITTGNITTANVTALKETRVAMGANNIDLSAGNYFTKTISVATTLTVSNVPTSGTAASFILDLTNGGSATITWWTGMKWSGGTAPTLTAAGRDVLGFFSHDGGTTWTGLVLGKDVK